jgi:hypothetical protein
LLALLSIFTVHGFAMDTAFEPLDQMTVRGRLQRTVEPWRLACGRWREETLIINAQRFSSESWFKEGAEVEAVGETKSDVMTVYMEGTPFEARSLRPFAQGGSQGQSRGRRQQKSHARGCVR